MTDREAFPAAWVSLLTGGAALLFWRFVLGGPSIGACWFYSRFHLYCPACGGTRALEALFHGQILRSFYFNPAVPLALLTAAFYLLSQLLWRLRGRRGWTLHYHNRWLSVLLAVLILNCALRNLLWFVFRIPL